MSVSTNIGAFGRRFAPLVPAYDDVSAALFFVFRTRDLARVPTLPRDTALRRLVLDRATGPDGWQIGTGFLRLPVPREVSVPQEVSVPGDVR
jgi:hypothetical protein